ncbi:MAG: hypothetical protein KGH62_03865, partial [Candidatus Micrarchaeota archaeon]|nr:hypothetical protein [Candidatus Micrarchaeota archaeon]
MYNAHSRIIAQDHKTPLFSLKRGGSALAASAISLVLATGADAMPKTPHVQPSYKEHASTKTPDARKDQTSTSVICFSTAAWSVTTCDATTSGRRPHRPIKFSSNSGSFADESCTTSKNIEQCQVYYAPTSPGEYSVNALYFGDPKNKRSHGADLVSVSQPTPSNWAGYVFVSSRTNPAPKITSIDASWVVESVEGVSGAASQWAGIGGTVGGDKTLIQAGTVWQGNSYYAFTQMLPSQQTSIHAPISVKAGDSVRVSISLVPNTSNYWKISIQNITENESYSQTVQFDSSMLSADLIQENPKACYASILGPYTCSDVGLANFGTANFDTIPDSGNVTMAGRTVRLSALQYYKMPMVSSNGDLLAVPSQ